MRGPQQESSHQQRRQQQQQRGDEKEDEDEQKISKKSDAKDESRLARVRRVLGGSLLGRGSSGSSAPSYFGAELEIVEQHNETGVPYIVHRICVYIESHGFHNPSLFRLAGGSSKLADRLKLGFERRGDVDLESVACPATAALLLRQYLKELPKPVVSPTCLSKLLQLHSRERTKSRECWIDKTRDLLANELPDVHGRLLEYLLLFFGRFEGQHGWTGGVSGIFAPIMMPHIPPATVLMRDLLLDASLIYPECTSVKEATVNGVKPGSEGKVSKESKDDFGPSFESSLLILTTKPPKRKDRRDSCGQERKLIRSNSEERIWENSKRMAGDGSSSNSTDTIRRVSSHEDFNSAKHHHILSKLQKDMGHGLRHVPLPLHERTNVSPASPKASLAHSSNDVVLATEKFDCDAERLRNSERFSRGITPRGRRQVRRRKLQRSSTFDQNSSKENEIGDSESHVQGQSFLEMLNSGPSRSPSPVRPASLEHDDANKPTLANWSYQVRQRNDEEMNERVQDMVSPRNSILIPRRFYGEDENDDQENVDNTKEYGLKTLMKQINSLKKKIKKYEGEFEDNFGYRPSHSDKMSDRDIKRIVYELNKVRKEHKILKESFFSNLMISQKLQCHDENISTNNNSGEEVYKPLLMKQMVNEIERKLSDKRLKFNRPENMEELSYEELLDEKNSMQKSILHIENTFGKIVSNDDRAIIRPLYDKYHTLKRLLIRAGANRFKDSMSELATILEHEAMDFTSSAGHAIYCDRRASEPDMSHRGILDCIESTEQINTDSDSQHSSSDGSRGVVETLHSLPKDELVHQQRITKEEKKRLRRALKELEMQFEARVGRRMQREDRGPQVNVIYDTYKQTKAKLRLISALLAKST